MATVIDVAAYVLDRCGAMTTMKMQKLVFYSQAQALAQTGQPLFSEDFQAWRGGPVSPRLFAEHRSKMIIRPNELPVAHPETKLTDRERAVIDAVCDVLHERSGNELSNRTHQEDPWKDARRGLDPAASSHNIISQESMRHYYSAHPVV